MCPFSENIRAVIERRYTLSAVGASSESVFAPVWARERSDVAEDWVANDR